LLKISGIAASEALDTSAEKISIEGMDISSLEAGEGIFNFEHRSPKSSGASPLDILGAITFAKKIFKESDCDNANQRKYWKQVELPFLYIEGSLFDSQEPPHIAADALAAQIKFYKSQNLPLVARFSIDGSTLERDDKNPQILKQTIARDVAITMKPCNRSCNSDVMEEPKAELEKRIKGDDPSHYQENGLYRMPGVSFEMTFDYPDTPDDLLKTEEELEKAWMAGSGAASPSSLTQGAATQKEDFAVKKTFMNKVTAAFRDWDKKSPLSKHLQKKVPESTQSFIDHFCDLVDTLRLKKATELQNHMTSLMKGKALEDAIARLPQFQAQEPKEPLAPTVALKPPTPQLSLTSQQRERAIAALPNFSADTRHQPAADDVPTKPEIAPNKPIDLINKKGIQAFSSKWMTPQDKKKKSQSVISTLQTDPSLVVTPNADGWSAMPKKLTASEHYLAKSAEATTAFFHPESGTLSIQQGSFPVAQSNPDQFKEFAQHPLVSSFHKRAVAGWKQLNSALRAKSTPDEIIQIASKFAQHPVEKSKLLSNETADLTSQPELDQSKLENLRRLVQQYSNDGRGYMGDHHEAVAPFAVSTPNAQYAIAALGVGNVVPQDPHLIRSMFGLDSVNDQTNLKAIQKALAVNPTVWDDVVKFYGNNHDAFHHVKSGEHKEHFDNFSDESQFPAAMLHWLTIPSQEESEGKTDSGQSNFLGKSESNLPLIDQWIKQHGHKMALMMFLAHLAPRILATKYHGG